MRQLVFLTDSIPGYIVKTTFYSEGYGAHIVTVPTSYKNAEFCVETWFHIKYQLISSIGNIKAKVVATSKFNGEEFYSKEVAILHSKSEKDFEPVYSEIFNIFYSINNKE